MVKNKDLNEYEEYLESVDKTIRILNSSLKITEDPLVLAETIKRYFLAKRKNKVRGKIRALEIGAGQGIVSILLSDIEEIEKIDCVEIQEEIYDILIENIEKNGLGGKLQGIEKDISQYVGSYDMIFSNPPYMKLNSGKIPDQKSVFISKYEEKLTLEKLVENIKRLLKNRGIFFVIIPNSRLNDMFAYIYKNKLSVVSLYIKKYKKIDLLVIQGKKGGKNNAEIEINIL